MTTLEVVAQICDIVTATIAVTASLTYGIARLRRRRKLEDYLEKEYSTNPRRYGPKDLARRSTMHCVAALRMPEDEILKAAFGSRSIDSVPATNPNTGRADAIMLHHKPA